ncbi:MAG: DUF4258 domain-containing protein [Bacteroidetes bacterium]|nr:DUF4258 domain-containing protein [Bacteroidota bacterium]MBK8658622.1 DUF4258 domain-containing protein [Bacteroidota bacterium]
MSNIVLSKHAKEQLVVRAISEEFVWATLDNTKPYIVEDGLTVYHGVVSENNKQYLIRIFVNEEVNPNLIVTVYKTSKISKYL